MTHEEIRAQLLRTAAFHALGRFDSVARYADEAARTLAQALAAPAPAPSASGSERDAAVRALLATLADALDTLTGATSGSARNRAVLDLTTALHAVRRFYPEGT